jgi:hypothetical protein
MASRSPLSDEWVFLEAGQIHRRYQVVGFVLTVTLGRVTLGYCPASRIRIWNLKGFLQGISDTSFVTIT